MDISKKKCLIHRLLRKNLFGHLPGRCMSAQEQIMHAFALMSITFHSSVTEFVYNSSCIVLKEEFT